MYPTDHKRFTVPGITRLFLGVFFVYSAWAKTYPIFLFQQSLMEAGINAWPLARLLSYTIISVEYLIGSCYLLNLFTHKKLPIFTLLMLALFSLVLTYQVIFKPGITDCGCFGTSIILTPLQSLVKNIILMGITWLYLSINNHNDPPRYALFGAIVVLAIAFPLVRNMDISQQPPAAAIAGKPYPLDVTRINLTQKEQVPDSLLTGKKILACLSAGCTHCQLAAKKISFMHRLNPSIPFYLFLAGDPVERASFLNATHTSHLPLLPIENSLDLLLLTGGKVPMILWLENGYVVKKTFNNNTREADIEAWLQLPILKTN